MSLIDIQNSKSASNSSASSGTPSAPCVSSYNDYRLFLRDYYEYKRATESSPLRPYSYSMFAASADIKSPNYLKLVIEGQRNLSPQMSVKFAKAMRLSRSDTAEFVLLVEFNQASDPQERAQYLRQLNEMRFSQQVEQGGINSKTWDLLPNWLGWVVFAMADQKDVQLTPEKVRQLLRVSASLDEIKKALDRLMAAGLLTKTADTAELVKARDFVEDPKDVPVALIKKLQMELTQLGMESLFHDSPADREFGAATMAMTEEEFQRLKFELRQLRKKWQKEIAVKRSEGRGDRVYQLNMQLFPVTK